MKFSTNSIENFVKRLMKDDFGANKTINHNNIKNNGSMEGIGDSKLKAKQFVNMEKIPIIRSMEPIPVCEKCSIDVLSDDNNSENQRKSSNHYFDFNCADCKSLIYDSKTSVSQLMAIARQWTFDIQSNIDILIHEMLRKGASPDDRDELTDMTLLHFVSRSGADGIGDADKALQLATYLVERCQANPNLRSSLTDMTALHMAVYFDVAPLVGYLVTVIDPLLLDSPCQTLSGQNPLHIAAANLSLRSARILLSAGANVLLKDDLMRTPFDCVPEDFNEKLLWFKRSDPDIALELRTILEEATMVISGEQNAVDIESLKTAKVVLSALGFEIGDRVIVGDQKVGILRYCGPTQFATGFWTGVELDEPIGKNDGSIDGIRYFHCSPGHGIFAPINKISKLDADYYDFIMSPESCRQQQGGNKLMSMMSLNYNINHAKSKIDTGLSRNSIQNINQSTSTSCSSSTVNSENVHIGSRVFLTDRKTGIVHFIGTTKFALGIWYGIELTRPLGKNDGSIQGVRYFTCPNQHGVFVQLPRIAQVLFNPGAAGGIKKNFSCTSSSQDDGDESDRDDENNDVLTNPDSDLSFNISGTSSLDYATINQLSSSLLKTSTTKQPGAMLKRSSSMRQHSLSAVATLPRRLNFSQNNHEQFWLRVGVNVLVNGMVGVVRYIGPLENPSTKLLNTPHNDDSSIFIGIELRVPQGKNDGSLNGKRYFTCKAKHGLFVKPNKVTVRGINASKLLFQQQPSLLQDSQQPKKFP